MITPDEKIVIEKLVEAWNAFLKLPNEHPDDQLEFRQMIHSAQMMILARTGRREINNG